LRHVAKSGATAGKIPRGNNDGWSEKAGA
jgi:hypothetical protein